MVRNEKNNLLYVFKLIILTLIFLVILFLSTKMFSNNCCYNEVFYDVCFEEEKVESDINNVFFETNNTTTSDYDLYNKTAQLPEFGYDFDYVVGVVAAESRGEPYEGQVAVAQCILETSRKQMITPEEVVKMKNRYASPCKNENEKDLVVDACIDVFIHGEKAFDEPIEYFYSTFGGFVSDWHEKNLEYVATIGNHKFFKER